MKKRELRCQTAHNYDDYRVRLNCCSICGLRCLQVIAKKKPAQFATILDFRIVAHAPKGSDAPVVVDTGLRGARVFDDVLAIIWDNLEHPVTEIRSLIRNVFEGLLDLLDIQSKWLQNQTETTQTEFSLDTLLALRLLRSPWHLKGRYALLCDVTKRLGAQKVLRLSDALPDEIFKCFSVSALSQAAARLYAELCKTGCAEWQRELFGSKKQKGKKKAKGKGQTTPPHDQGVEETQLASQWSAVWLSVVVKALVSDNRLLRYHVATYCLPETLKWFPGSMAGLVREFLGELHGLQTRTPNSAGTQRRVTEDSRTRHLNALFVTLRSGRKLGLISSDSIVQDEGAQETLDSRATHIPYSLILEALSHPDTDVQLEALAFVCCDLRTTTEVSPLEVKLMRHFLPSNLNIWETSVRQQYNICLKAFLGRMREAWVSCHRSSEVVGRQLEKLDEIGDHESPACLALIDEMEVVDEDADRTGNLMVQTACWLEALLLASLYPGASYQRTITAVKSLDVLMTWATKFPNSVLDHLPEGFPDLFSQRNSSIITGAVLNSREDVRKIASALLLQHFGSRMQSTPVDDVGEFIAAAEKTANRARVIVASARKKECEAGADLLKVVFGTFVESGGIYFELSDTGALVAKHSRGTDQSQPPPSDVALHFINLLLTMIESHFKACQDKLAESSRNTAMHGLIFSLRKIWDLAVPEGSARSISSEWIAAARRAIDLGMQVGSFALGLLVVDPKSYGGSSSFANVNAALDTAISQFSGDKKSTAGADGMPDPVSIDATEARDFVLALSWRALKEVSMFLGAVVQPLSLPGEQEEPLIIQREALVRVGQWFQQVLVSCRHKGVIETCAIGFSEFCQRLSRCAIKETFSLPVQWLDQSLEAMSLQTVVSITRRSAGLPYIIQGIITTTRRTSTIEAAFTGLLSLASRLVDDAWQEVNDLPQVRAMHTLNVIFRDSALSEASQPFMEEAAILTIQGFAASNWAIANASMMLYATLQQRMLGFKRVGDASSSVNLITVREFSSRYADLYAFILQRLDAIMNCAATGSDDDALNSRQLVRPELYPILSLISRLQCNSEEDTDTTGTTASFRALLSTLRSNCLLPIRMLAAKALVPMVPATKIEDEIIAWLSTAAEFQQHCIVNGRTSSADTASNFHHNTLHGSLLCASMFIEVWIAAPTSTAPVASALSNLVWLLDSSKYRVCDIVAMCYLDICKCFVSLDGADVCRLVDTVGSALRPTLSVCDHHQVGNFWLRSACVDIMWAACFRKDAGAVGPEVVALLAGNHIDVILHLLRRIIEKPPNADMLHRSLVLEGLNEGLVKLCMSNAFTAVEQSHYLPLALQVCLLLHMAGRVTTFPVQRDQDTITSLDFLDAIAGFESGFKNQRLKEVCVAIWGCCLDDVATDYATSPDAVLLAEQWMDLITAGAHYDASSSMRMVCACIY